MLDYSNETIQEVVDTLDSIAKSLSKIANHGITVKQLSTDCMTGWHRSEPIDGCKGCGCECHENEA